MDGSQNPLFQIIMAVKTLKRQKKPFGDIEKKDLKVFIIFLALSSHRRKTMTKCITFSYENDSILSPYKILLALRA